ncbi:uncharacterized protein LOC124289125 [Haliotis rubra]|uniref:uncharacterized protein LOC124289125 n=1 Tax=Haliotis rubra TaxID=36100 RepID=UPI001EE4F41E|nr:uncharacterized protein LOC124289125 [Haliotis rubra]XP_046581692.1 uncharacterized protein LOC124289125 [Haliotis rubra]
MASMGNRPKRPRTRPLGYVPVKNPIFLEREKTEFRDGLQTISDIIHYGDDMKTRVRSSMKTSSRMNNANIAKYYNNVPDRVISPDLRDNDGLFRQTSSICNRKFQPDRTSLANLQCEVLGPFFCADCSKTRRQDMNCETHRAMYPQIAVHQRALVAPNKVMQFNSSKATSSFKDKRVLSCGCIVDAENAFHIPVVYTQHDVHNRVRHAHQAGCSLVHRKALPSTKTIPGRLELSNTEEPETYNVENIRVSVHFNSPTEEGRRFFNV